MPRRRRCCFHSQFGPETRGRFGNPFGHCSRCLVLFSDGHHKIAGLTETLRVYKERGSRIHLNLCAKVGIRAPAG
jgi:hypothetical protein